MDRQIGNFYQWQVYVFQVMSRCDTFKRMFQECYAKMSKAAFNMFMQHVASRPALFVDMLFKRGRTLVLVAPFSLGTGLLMACSSTIFLVLFRSLSISLCLPVFPVSPLLLTPSQLTTHLSNNPCKTRTRTR